MESGSSSPPRRIDGQAASRGRSNDGGGPLSPPYWQHQRFDSNASIDSIRPTRRLGITLEDHTEESSEQSGAVWAKSVTIEDHVVISGSRTGVGAYVVWNCTVETLDGGPMKIRKRYSEFDELRAQLLKTFPKAETSMPPLPPKSVICMNHIHLHTHQEN
ncbi:MAG: hypothetical protein M1812_003118 [Candelaria pacifica]|nr:MAG: hypothetical protein M1812_003118 [Candelaria pacifica]